MTDKVFFLKQADSQNNLLKGEKLIMKYNNIENTILVKSFLTLPLQCRPVEQMFSCSALKEWF